MSFAFSWQGPVLTLIGWSLIHTLWLGGMLAIGAELIALTLRGASARTRYLVLLLALLAIPVSAIVCTALHADRSFAVLEPSSAAIVSPSLDPQPSTSHRNAAAVEHASVEPPAARRGSLPIAADASPAETAAAHQPGFRDPDSVTGRFPALVREPAVWLPGIAWFWMAGVAFFSLRLLTGCVSTNRLSSRGTSPVPPEVARMATRIAERIRLRRTVSVVASTLAVVPTTIGFFRPLILLPFSTLSSLSAQELESILAHELAHIRRGDFLVNLMQMIVEVLLFYHPAVWWISRRIRHERELACDDAVLRLTGDHRHYARALVCVAEHAVRQRLAMTADGGQLTARIRRILGRPAVAQSSRWHVLIAAVLATSVTAVVIAVAQPAKSANGPTTDTTQTAVAGAGVIDPISGRILGPDGNPLAGAHVHLRRRPFRHHDGPCELAQTVTDDKGLFEFRGVEAPDFSTRYQQRLFPLDVIAMKPGLSIRWQRLTNAQTDIRLQLKRESQFIGVLQDDTGSPVPDAVIRVMQLMSLNTIRKIDVAGGHTPSANGDSFLDISESMARIVATTDSQGRFVLSGLPHRVGMLLRVDDRRLVDTEVYAATTDEQMPDIPAGKLIVPPPSENVQQIMSRRVRAELLPIHSSPAEVTVARGVHLRVRLLSDATGQPLSGAKITLGHDLPEATSDRQGVCDFYRLEPNSTPVLEVLPPGTTDLLGQRDMLDLSSRLEVEREIRLRRGAVLSGQVLDAASKQGVADAAVAFIPVEESPEPIVPRRVTTDQAGHFRLVVPATPGRVALASPPVGYVMPPAAKAASANSKSILRPQLGQPITGLAIEATPQPGIPIRFVDATGEPVAATADIRIFSSSNAYFTSEAQVDASGRIDLGRLVRGRETPAAIQILARSSDHRLAGFFRTKDVVDLQTDRAKEIVLRPTATVSGSVLDRETQEPIAGARVSLSVNYTATGGQGVGTFTCDKAGTFHFDDLVPGMRYLLGAGAENYASLNAIHTQFVAADAASHVIDIALTPEMPKPIADLAAVEAPSTSGLAPAAAYELLGREYAKAKDAYRALLDKHRSGQITRQIVRLREPNPVYAEAFMQLANRDDVRGTAVELQALTWLCDVSLIAGTEHRYRHLKAKAAARLLQDYAEVAEIADVVSSVIYASPDRYAAAQRLMKSPHHAVRGRACFTCAEVLNQRYQDPYRGRQDAVGERAIELYEQVIADYDNITFHSGRTIGDVARDRLFALRNLQIGAPAPEIEGVDLEGRPMKLSDFRGQVVVIRYWQSGLAFFDDLKRMAEEYKDKPLVIVGVNTDDDREQAAKVAQQKGLAIRHWHDPERQIHRRWSGSWPNTHVIGRDGKILYLGQRRSRTALEDVLDAAVAE